MTYNFKQNKYTRWYLNIIDTRKNMSRKKYQGEYFESHHIIPKSLGGKNDKSNKVLLTPKEHFICHWLLCNMMQNRNDEIRMIHALSKMLSDKRNSREYETKRLYLSFIKNKNGMTDQHKNKISEMNKNKIIAKDVIGNFYRIERTDARWLSGELKGITKGIRNKPHNKGFIVAIDTETNMKVRISKELFDNIRYVGIRKNCSPYNKGKKLKPLSEEQKNNISILLKNKKWYNDGIKNYRLNIEDLIPPNLVPGRIKWVNL